MDTRNNNMSDLTGYIVSHLGARLWLPHAIAKAVEAERANANEAAIAAKVDTRVAHTSIKSTPANVNATGVSNALGIRVGSNNDIADATALAERILKKANNHLDPATVAFSKNLFIATAMYVSYSEKLSHYK